MDNFGITVRKLREEKKMPLRQVSEALGIDQAIISKLERKQRRATAEQVEKLASFFQVPLEDLQAHWLSDEIACILKNQENALNTLNMAREKIILQAREDYDRESVFQQLYNIFRKTDYSKVWAFGSYASGNDFFARSLSVLVELFEHQEEPQKKQILALKNKLERLTKLQINLLFKKYKDDFPQEAASEGMILIIDKMNHQ